MLGLIKLMHVGSEAVMAYYKLNIPYELEKHKRKWKNQISQLRCAMEKADQEWREIIPLELWPLLRLFFIKTEVNEIYEKVKRKYH